MATGRMPNTAMKLTSTLRCARRFAPRLLRALAAYCSVGPQRMRVRESHSRGGSVVSNWQGMAGSRALGGSSPPPLKTGNHCPFSGTASFRDGDVVVLGSWGEVVQRRDEIAREGRSIGVEMSHCLTARCSGQSAGNRTASILLPRHICTAQNAEVSSLSRRPDTSCALAASNIPQHCLSSFGSAIRPVRSVVTCPLTLEASFARDAGTRSLSQRRIALLAGLALPAR